MSGIVRSNNAGQSGIASNVETIDSDDYVDASIDNAHLADDAVDSDELAADAVTNAKLANMATSTVKANATSGSANPTDVVMADGDFLIANASGLVTVPITGDVVISNTGAATIQANSVDVAMIEDIARGSIIYGNASAATAALAKGTETYVLTAGANDISWAAASSGAVVREGGDVGEETSTSNSSAVTSSTGTISILAGETAIVRWSARKTTGGGGESGTCGAHIYAGGTDTVICTPTTASTTTFPWGSADTDSAQNGPAGFFISGRSSSGTDYLNSSAGTVLGGYAPVGGGSSSVFAGQKMQVDDDYPAGEITRIDVLAIGGGAITVGTDFLNAYSFTGS